LDFILRIYHDARSSECQKDGGRFLSASKYVSIRELTAANLTCIINVTVETTDLGRDLWF
jgi:hypothetical protein